MHSRRVLHSSSFFFFNDTATTEIYTLSLHDALPILLGVILADVDLLALLGRAARVHDEAFAFHAFPPLVLPRWNIAHHPKTGRRRLTPRDSLKPRPARVAADRGTPLTRRNRRARAGGRGVSRACRRSSPPRSRRRREGTRSRC